MYPPVLFADAEQIVVDYLGPALITHGDHAPVGTRVPNPRPARFVLARRLGGVRDSLVVDAAQIGFECWAADEVDAEALAQLCRSLIHQLRGTVQDGTTVYRVEDLGGPANLPDPDSNDPRYVFSVVIHLRGGPLPEGS